jgi:hypothetical protein
LTPGFSPRFSALAKTDSARDGGCFPRDASSRERPPPLRMMAPNSLSVTARGSRVVKGALGNVGRNRRGRGATGGAVGGPVEPGRI